MPVSSLQSAEIRIARWTNRGRSLSYGRSCRASNAEDLSVCLPRLFLGPIKRRGQLRVPSFTYIFLVRLSMSPVTPWLHDTPTLGIMELVIIALLILGVSWLGKYMSKFYFAIFSVDSFLALVIGGLTSDSACSSSLPGCSPIVYSHERFWG